MQNNVESGFKIERTEDFYTAARALSEYIKELDLPQLENDTLVALAVAQVEFAELGAFIHGFGMGTAFRKWRRARFFRRKGETSLEDIVRVIRS